MQPCAVGFVVTEDMGPVVTKAKVIIWSVNLIKLI